MTEIENSIIIIHIPYPLWYDIYQGGYRVTIKLRQFIHQWVWLVLIFFCIVGLIYPVIGGAALICMLAPILVAFFKGRMWCGNFCPRGSFNDIVLSKLTLKRRMPAVFKQTWFRIVFLIVLMSAFAIQLTLVWGNLIMVGEVFVRMIVITTLVAILLGIIYNQRAWCLICPMGTLAHFAAKMGHLNGKRKDIRFIKGKCVDCKVCTKSCPIHIEVHRYKQEGRVTDPDCLKCGTCIETCPKKSLYIA